MSDYVPTKIHEISHHYYEGITASCPNMTVDYFCLFLSIYESNQLKKRNSMASKTNRCDNFIKWIQ